jgi:tetratricopeptide (TPR) repeat protein
MKRWAWVGLVVLAVLPYVGAIHAPLMYDDRTILDNRWLVHDAGPVSVFEQNFRHGTREEHSDLYRPLTVLSLAWNMRVTPSREGMRIVNIAAHALAVLALFWMLSLLLPDEAAWMGAALFAVHPLASEAVLWAVGRAEILAAVFGSVAFGLFVGSADERGLRGRRLALSAAAMFAALCFKESAAAWFVIGAAWMAFGSHRGGLSPKIRVAQAGAYVLPLVVYAALRSAVVGLGPDPAPFVDNPLIAVGGVTRAANAILLFARYAGKMLWPETLSVDYGFDQLPVTPLLPWGAILAIAIALGVAGAVVVLHRKGYASAAFLTAFVPCAFAVTGNLAFPIGTIFGERLAYTPLIGFCGLTGLALVEIPHVGLRRVAAAALLVACGARTIARGGDYHDLVTFNEATAQASPRAVKALVNAGRTRLRLGHAGDALPLFERAVAIWPDYARAWHLLGDARDAVGDASGAQEARRREHIATSKAAPGDEPL